MVSPIIQHVFTHTFLSPPKSSSSFQDLLYDPLIERVPHHLVQVTIIEAPVRQVAVSLVIAGKKAIVSMMAIVGR